MRAIFIAVGSELLEGSKNDTNSMYVSRRLLESGIKTDMKFVVGDSMEDLAWTVKNACRRCQLVIICGGLGPTEDDLTREAVSRAVKRDLVFHEGIVTDLKEMFRKRGFKSFPETNTRQAFILEGAEVLKNSEGTAPGQILELTGCTLLLLPGPPRELKPIFDVVYKDKLSKKSKYFNFKRVIKFSGISESEADERMAAIYSRKRNLDATILASPGFIELHLSSRSKNSVDEASELVMQAEEEIKEALKENFITDRDLSFKEYVVEELKKKKIRISFAESCTGGLLSSAVTDVPGSSDIFSGSVIAYSNELKTSLLGVSEELLDKHGAVSMQSAESMAKGVRERTGSDVSLAVTGIAGPGGGRVGKPVGLVHFNINSDDISHGEYKIFSGSRETVKMRAVNHALFLIHKKVIKGD